MAKPPSLEPSGDEQALLAAVIAHPDEDTPRLMYADWLDENADALPTRDPKEMRLRAEFIRAQIEAARLPPNDPGAKALRDRIAELEMLAHEAVGVELVFSHSPVER
ncbi:TIGR02996 domain-containing protein [Frigoriglobus tundricola]|uniref:TIGR02996 domain-containing protein n=1 Tax=Frigoriglobus tundricola TaxID=2774151 RepID=UPI00148EC099|nr:TIGR02996 domain-containing protein [Frigoriglobus tundricola]